VVRFSIPEPHTRANILAAYEKVLKDTPRAKLLLVTHVSNRNGLIPPVAEIVAMAKARGVDVILDSAQAVGQMPFDVKATGADFRLLAAQMGRRTAGRGRYLHPQGAAGRHRPLAGQPHLCAG
jgi:selenocysteine lyase/cysteine desulfurase